MRSLPESRNLAKIRTKLPDPVRYGDRRAKQNPEGWFPKKDELTLVRGPFPHQNDETFPRYMETPPQVFRAFADPVGVAEWGG